jgi:glycosyltransferase involved in cell wall biosynthesis
MKASVVLCTHHPRPSYLERALAALQAQTLSKDQWEILLIDNASTPPVADRFDLSWHTGARKLVEGKLGKLNAWLLGIAESKGEILVFVDDDNVLSRDYLERSLTISVQYPFLGAWGGSCLPEYEIPLPGWVGKEVWRLTVCEIKEDVWSNLRDIFTTFPVGAGMCIRREVGRRYTEWCDHNTHGRLLDRSGKGLGGYGDMDLNQCAMDIGLGTGRFAQLTLTHLIPAARLSLEYFVRHAEGDAASLILYLAIRGLPFRDVARQTLLNKLIWKLYCWKHGVPVEQRKIREAHSRGLRRGLQLAEDYLKAANNK